MPVNPAFPPEVALRDRFEFWVPIEKAEETPEGDRILRGMASTGDKDLQGEKVLQRGLNIEYLKSRGFINWDHGKGASAIIGEPIKAEITGNGLYAEGKLYKGKNAPEAEAAWNLAKTLEANNSGRRLGWSIQGAVRERQGEKIVKADVLHLALTAQPVNPHTYAEIAKSFATEEEIEQTTNDSTSQPIGDGMTITQLLKSETRSADGSITREWRPIAFLSKGLMAGSAADASAKTGGAAVVPEDLEGKKTKKDKKPGDDAKGLKTTTYKSLAVGGDFAYKLIRKAFPSATDDQCEKLIAYANQN
jgi:hypothetical protein